MRFTLIEIMIVIAIIGIVLAIVIPKIFPSEAIITKGENSYRVDGYIENNGCVEFNQSNKKMRVCGEYTITEK